MPDWSSIDHLSWWGLMLAFHLMGFETGVDIDIHTGTHCACVVTLNTCLSMCAGNCSVKFQWSREGTKIATLLLLLICLHCDAAPFYKPYNISILVRPASQFASMFEAASL
ncbi:hypothetical protein Vafri_13872 [Volvox africanus]|uniref:Pherophorin domain-containing protein n=1 Tax=Volvox africanus TaxID=51714 RepID=A0A8J4BDE9_9CHLO|nr:hypothetical protein Vafri_13872 [Volvox africanus]